MTEVTTIGLDIAKSVFQVHGVGADGGVVVRRQLRRAQVLPFFQRQAPCLAIFSRSRPSSKSSEKGCKADVSAGWVGLPPISGRSQQFDIH